MKNENKKRILIFCSREICYYSADFFAGQIADELEKNGYEVIIQGVDMEKDLDGQLAKYVGEEYYAILDFNSLLPRMELEEGKRYLDAINAPFFNYIVDHPLYHHPGLVIELENYHAIGIDEDHCEYIRKYYPNIKSVHMIPLGATEALHQIPLEEKKEEILFIGTVQPSEKIYHEIKQNKNVEQKKDILNLIERLLSNETMSHEDAIKEIFRQRGTFLEENRLPEYMNVLYESDKYLRNYLREKAIKTLIENEIPVSVVGNGWKKSELSENKNLTILEPVDFSMSFQKIAQYALSLNVSPLFRAGAHDRIFAAMANESVCLTDTNRYMEKYFSNKSDISLYSFHHMDHFVESARTLIEDKSLRYSIARNAKKHFDKSFSWKERTKELLDAFEKSYSCKEE